MLSFLFLFISLFFLEGCAPTQQIEKERMISPDRLIKRLEANRRKVKNFTGTGSIAIKNSELDTKSRFQVEIKKPDSVKVVFYGPFGIDLAYALITQQNFQFYDVINNVLYKGKIKPGVMKEILKVNISFDDLIDLLTGSVNLTDKLRREPDLVEVVDDFYKLTYTDSLAGKSNIYFVQTDNLEITQFQQNNLKGKNLLDSKFFGFTKIEDVSIPEQINLNDIEYNQRIKINYRTIEVNKELGKLKLEIPDDARIIER